MGFSGTKTICCTWQAANNITSDEHPLLEQGADEAGSRVVETGSKRCIFASRSVSPYITVLPWATDVQSANPDRFILMGSAMGRFLNLSGSPAAEADPISRTPDLDRRSNTAA